MSINDGTCDVTDCTGEREYMGFIDANHPSDRYDPLVVMLCSECADTTGTFHGWVAAGNHDTNYRTVAEDNGYPNVRN